MDGGICDEMLSGCVGRGISSLWCLKERNYEHDLKRNVSANQAGSRSHVADEHKQLDMSLCT